MASMAEITTICSQRSIILKHFQAAMYLPCIEAIALTIVDIPVAFVNSLVFSCILYFLTELEVSASQFL